MLSSRSPVRPGVVELQMGGMFRDAETDIRLCLFKVRWSVQIKSRFLPHLDRRQYATNNESFQLVCAADVALQLDTSITTAVFSSCFDTQ